jgi:hypothetical protein
MKTLQIKDSVTASNGQVETIVWENKRAVDVLREQFADTCILSKPVDQPKTGRNDVWRPTTYVVRDRIDAVERTDTGDSVGVLVELP